jgi:hypothetical protein
VTIKERRLKKINKQVNAKNIITFLFQETTSCFPYLPKNNSLQWRFYKESLPVRQQKSKFVLY